MGFQTSASHCILPSPQRWQTSKPWFYQTGHGGVSLFSQLSSIRRPKCSQPFTTILWKCLSHQQGLFICAIRAHTTNGL